MLRQIEWCCSDSDVVTVDENISPWKPKMNNIGSFSSPTLKFEPREFDKVALKHLGKRVEGSESILNRFSLIPTQFSEVFVLCQGSWGQGKTTSTWR